MQTLRRWVLHTSSSSYYTYFFITWNGSKLQCFTCYCMMQPCQLLRMLLLSFTFGFYCFSKFTFPPPLHVNQVLKTRPSSCFYFRQLTEFLLISWWKLCLLIYLTSTFVPVFVFYSFCKPSVCDNSMDASMTYIGTSCIVWFETLYFRVLFLTQLVPRPQTFKTNTFTMLSIGSW